MMKVIFLDIDGVLNSVEHSIAAHANKSSTRTHRVDPVRVGLLRWLVEQTGAKIVISSTWRYGHSLQWFEGYFEKLEWSAPIIGLTPKLDLRRGEEVDAWLRDDNEKVGEEITYVIFDDGSDFHDWQPLIKCDSVMGLTLKNILDAIDVLGLGPDGDPKEVESLRNYC